MSVHLLCFQSSAKCVPRSSQIPAAKQKSIAESMESTVGQVLKKLEDIRNAII